jgi:hypothetical protein
VTLAPPRWSEQQLKTDTDLSRKTFRDERVVEPLENYVEEYDDVRDRIEDLLEMTVDLSRIRDVAVEVMLDARMRETARYLASPPISNDDLKVLAESDLTARSIKKNPDEARLAVEVILTALDRNRFPWVSINREPTEAEREIAMVATASMVGVRRVMTGRANDAKTAQEARVAEQLAAAGLTAVPARPIRTLDDAPHRGEFCAAECLVGTRKADLTIRLFDGRLMPLECKVSNSYLNSIKRVNNDAAVKAETWIDEFGRLQVVPAAVLSGVFKVKNLEQAQDRGLTLFWAHALDRLVDFVLATRG